VVDSWGEQIHKIRVDLGWSQAQLADMAGVSRTVVSDIETGKCKNPSIITLWKLAHALGVSLAELFRY